MSMTGESHVRAALDWLAGQDAPESAIAAHELGTAGSGDDARRWVRRIVDGERDGAWDGDLVATAQALLTLRELKDAASLKEQDPAVGRALDWVRDRRGRPGAWTDGCDPGRHARGVCHHFAGGFFSPGPPDAGPMELVLPSGATVAADDVARFTASTIALRCMLVWRGVGTDARLHLGVLRPIVLARSDRPGAMPDALGTTALLEALRTLVASPDPEDRAAVATALRVVAGTQRADGSWMEADPFHALAVFGEAFDAGITDERVTRALEYGARLLTASQHEDGSWGPEFGPRRALIGIRTLARVGSWRG